MALNKKLLQNSNNAGTNSKYSNQKYVYEGGSSSANKASTVASNMASVAANIVKNTPSLATTNAVNNAVKIGNTVANTGIKAANTTTSSPSSYLGSYTQNAASYQAPAYKAFQASANTIAAMNQTQELLNKVNSGRTSYSDKLASLMEAYENRDKFAYDPNSDNLYQNALNTAMAYGQQAMSNTMGQAADLTGGYGSSYATSVASQAYNSQLQEAYNKLPEYYSLAYNAYNQETSDMLNQLNMVNQLDQSEYARNMDAYNASNSNWQTLYNQDYSKWADEFNQNMTLANYNLDKAVAENNMALNNANYELNKRETEAKLQQYQYELEQAKSAAANPSFDTLSSSELSSALNAYNTGMEKGGEEKAYSAVEAYLNSIGKNVDTDSLASYINSMTTSGDVKTMSFTPIGEQSGNPLFKGEDGKTYTLKQLKELGLSAEVLRKLNMAYMSGETYYPL